MTTPDSSWSGIMPNYVNRVWDDVAPLIERGKTHLDSVKGIKRAIEESRAQLWVMWRGSLILAAVVTRIADHDNGKVCVIAQCGGEEMESWLEYLDVLKAWARESGCTHIQIVGRKGWERVLPEFKQTGVVLEMTL